MVKKIIWRDDIIPVPKKPVIRARLFASPMMDTRTPETMFILQTRESDDMYYRMGKKHKKWFKNFYSVTEAEYNKLEKAYAKKRGKLRRIGV